MTKLPLTDRFGRRHNYLRIAITGRCNLRCRYCMPPEGISLPPNDEMLSFGELERLSRVFVSLGVTKIRFTGGEPLVRQGVEELCERVARIGGLETLAVTTNGVLLEEKVSRLHSAGVRQLNISLDTLRPDRFERITLRSQFRNVLSGIESAVRMGFERVKINVVVMKGFNDDELLDFVFFGRRLGVDVRFIEFMPFFGNGWSEVDFLPYSEMKEIIGSEYDLIPTTNVSSLAGPAKNYQIQGSNCEIGFITSLSEHFCSSCTRLRISADGKLRNCLFGTETFDLKEVLRSGGGDSELEHLIRLGLALKWETHPEIGSLVDSTDTAMVSIGG